MDTYTWTPISSRRKWITRRCSRGITIQRQQNDEHIRCTEYSTRYSTSLHGDITVARSDYVWSPQGGLDRWRNLVTYRVTAVCISWAWLFLIPHVDWKSVIDSEGPDALDLIVCITGQIHNGERIKTLTFKSMVLYQSCFQAFNNLYAHTYPRSCP
jgi:hypothetical protein